VHLRAEAYNDCVPPSQRGRSTSFGRASGIVAGVLGALCVLATLCFRFPHVLVYDAARPFYSAHLDAFRMLLLASIVVALILGCASVLLNGRSRHGVMGLVLGVLAILLGGSRAEALTSNPQAITAGLDYFALSLFVLALLFVPMERIWPLRTQAVFRRDWQTDLAHFFVNHAGVQLLAFLSMVPVQLLFAWAVDSPLQAYVRRQPLWLQFVEVLMVVELASYWVHRAFHQIPALWRFHAIHHSVEQMDWLAGSRLHVIDVVVTRLAGFLPVFVLGFPPSVVYGYLVFVSFHAVYIHANVNHRWPLLRAVITTPEFHHWHHAAEPAAVNKNFAVLLSCVDTLFGTAIRPTSWPSRYGVIDPAVPRGYWQQLLFPLKRHE
jgi:sterol desaturase/sphingolipid hydroxylase (fatty acid hydroxylase superfamily)